MCKEALEKKYVYLMFHFRLFFSLICMWRRTFKIYIKNIKIFFVILMTHSSAHFSRLRATNTLMCHTSYVHRKKNINLHREWYTSYKSPYVDVLYMGHFLFNWSRVFQKKLSIFNTVIALYIAFLLWLLLK